MLYLFRIFAGVKAITRLEASVRIQDKFAHLELVEYTGSNNRCRVLDKTTGLYYTPYYHNLIKGKPPGIETAEDKRLHFEYYSNRIHSNKYSYEEVNYIKTYIPVGITCKHHGLFFQKPRDHSKGNGCQKCAEESSGYYTKSKWVSKCRDGKGYIYVIRMYNDTDEFIKVGITSKSLEKRYTELKEYKFEQLLYIEDIAETIYDLEETILSNYSQYSHKPTKWFGGASECFIMSKKDDIINNILKTLKK